ncbi:MAG: 50S ribosomal protein L30 [Spirochaetes bacterium]|nr:50S ribosomal protein L30 [Spirochaetota bacterium]
MVKKIKIKLTKSIISENPGARKTVQALGFKKMHQVLEKADSPQIRGMINRVAHLVSIVE